MADGDQVARNKAQIERLNEEVINRGNVAAVDEILAADIKQPRSAMGQSSKLLRPGRGWNSSAGEVSALESFKAAVKALRTAFPDWTSIIDEQVGEGDKLVTRYTVTGTQTGEYLGRVPTGKKVSFAETVVAHFENGKVKQFWGLGDELGFLLSLGWIEPPLPSLPEIEAGAGGALTLAEAHAVIERAKAKAREIGLPVCAAVTDQAGDLLAFHRMDGARLVSIDAVIDKAWTSVRFGGVDTDSFAREIASDARLLAVFASTPRVKLLSGGLPLKRNGVLVGAVGISGGSDPQDYEVAKAAAADFHNSSRRR